MSRESIPSLPKVTAPATQSHGDREDSISIWQPAIADLATALRTSFARLSPTRASLLHDQIREVLRPESAQRLVCVAAASGTPVLDQSVIAIALLTPGSDAASVLHIDWVNPGGFTRSTRWTVGQNPRAASPAVSAAHAAAIWLELESIFLRSEVRFVQWATDPVRSHASRPRSMSDSGATANASTRTLSSTPFRWPESLNFTPLGTFEYLFLDRDSAGRWNSHRSPDGSGSGMHHGHRRVIFRPLDPSGPHPTASFEQLVERTYVDSLDCPALAEFRTSAEILQSYRDADGFAADLWYRVEAIGDAGDDPVVIGCVILARHRDPSTRDPSRVNPACVIELVYMGIVPEHRGRQGGQSVMAMVTEVCQQEGAERLILAVDETNIPAILAYRHFGMVPLLREMVWGRSVGAAENRIGP